VSAGNDTAPLVGLRTPAIILSSVDFPAPFFPINAILSPGLMKKEMFENKVVPENSTAMLSTDIIKYFYNVKFYLNSAKLRNLSRLEGGERDH